MAVCTLIVAGSARGPRQRFEAMFGKDQDASLSDLIQAALMLRYNQRQVG